MVRYYLDSCIWRDYFENRSDRFRPLGDWALDLIKKIIHEEGIILYSDLVEDELEVVYSKDEIRNNIFSIVPKEIFLKVLISENQSKESVYYSKKLGIPINDCIHAILARDNNAIMVTRDKHFFEFKGITEVKCPEELI